MADDKTTKTPEQPVTDSGPGKETPPAPPKEPEKVSVSPEPEKKAEPEVKNPQVSVYNFSEIMKEKKAEERAAAPGGEKPDPAKAEKPEKQPEAPKKAEEKPKEPEQPKRRGRPPKADKDKAATPKPKAPAQKPEKVVKKEPEKKAAPTVQAAPAPKESEKPQDAPRRGKEQIVYIKLNELHAFKNHPFEVRDDEEMRAMVSSVKDKGVTQPATPIFVIFSGLVFAPQVNFRQAGLLHLLPTRFASNSFVAEVKSSLLFPMFITSSNQNIDFIIS